MMSLIKFISHPVSVINISLSNINFRERYIRLNRSVKKVIFISFRQEVSHVTINSFSCRVCCLVGVWKCLTKQMFYSCSGVLTSRLKQLQSFSLEILWIQTSRGRDGENLHRITATEFHRWLSPEIENFTWSQICVERLNAFPKSPGIVVSLWLSWKCHPCAPAAFSDRTSSAANRICNKASTSLPKASHPPLLWHRRCAKNKFEKLRKPTFCSTRKLEKHIGEYNSCHISGFR